MAERADELSKALEGLEVDLDLLIAEVSFEEAVGSSVKADKTGSTKVKSDLELELFEPDQRGTLAETSANSTFEEQLKKTGKQAEVPPLVDGQSSASSSNVKGPVTPVIPPMGETPKIKAASEKKLSLDEMNSFIKPSEEKVTRPSVRPAKKNKPKSSFFVLSVSSLSFAAGALLSSALLIELNKRYFFLETGFSQIDPDTAFAFINAYKKDPLATESAVLLIAKGDVVGSPDLDSPVQEVRKEEVIEALGDHSISASNGIEVEDKQAVVDELNQGVSSQTPVAVVAEPETRRFCYRTDKQALESLQAKVNQLSLDSLAKVNFVETAEVKNYYVALSPQGQKKYSAARIRSSGVRETFVIKSGQHSGYLSLGLFSSREKAAKYSSHLGSLGIGNLSLLPNQKISMHYANIESPVELKKAGWMVEIACPSQE